jgi:hypothetical protein
MEPTDDACGSVISEFGMAQKAAGSVVAEGVCSEGGGADAVLGSRRHSILVSGNQQSA